MIDKLDVNQGCLKVILGRSTALRHPTTLPPPGSEEGLELQLFCADLLLLFFGWFQSGPGGQKGSIV